MSFIYIYYLLRDSIPDRKNIERKPYGNSHWMKRLWNPWEYGSCNHYPLHSPRSGPEEPCDEGWARSKGSGKDYACHSTSLFSYRTSTFTHHHLMACVRSGQHNVFHILHGLPLASDHQSGNHPIIMAIGNQSLMVWMWLVSLTHRSSPHYHHPHH